MAMTVGATKIQSLAERVGGPLQSAEEEPRKNETASGEGPAKAGKGCSP
ncbi:MAG: hypothetical protein K6U74_02375 [Firmicutes bacterium]|nr:hypothetical protein [Bacillota bacterium]